MNCPRLLMKLWGGISMSENVYFINPAWIESAKQDLDDEDMAGKIIEKNIPCLLTRVVDNKNLKDLFDINDDIY